MAFVHDPTPMTSSLAELLLAGALADPGRPLLFFGGKTYSRDDLADAVLRVAGWFKRAGFAGGDRVAFMLENQPEFLMAWLGAGLAGAVVVPLDPRLRSDELATRLEQTRPRAVIAHSGALPAILALRERIPSLQEVILVGAAPAGTTPWSALLEGPRAEPGTPAPDAPMEIMHTAGTTGRPRGVIWRHGGLPAAGAAMAQLLGLGARDRLMIVLPLYGPNAQFSLAMALATGGSILLERGFTASTFWNQARRGGATQVSLSGLLLSQLYKSRPRKRDTEHSIRRVLSISAPKELHEAFENRFGVNVIEVYGLAEAGFVAMNPVERGRRKLGTVGLPVPWWEVAVLDEDMGRAEPGAIGEICLRARRGPAVFWGGEPLAGDETGARAWHNGWLRSGDLGVADDEGFLTLVGHPDDVLRRRGKAYSTRPIEQALLRHPAIADAAVIAHPDGGDDQTVALVVLRAPVRFEDVARFCREWLDGQPTPCWFKAVESVPKTASGRIRKAELRKQPGIFDHLYRVS